MNDDEIKRLEAKLAAMQPVAPSMIVRERIRHSIHNIENESAPRRWRYAIAIAAAAAVALVVWLNWPAGNAGRHESPRIVRTNAMEPVRPPTMAAYFRATDLSPAQFDELLSKQSALVLPPPTSKVARRMFEP